MATDCHLGAWPAMAAAAWLVASPALAVDLETPVDLADPRPDGLPEFTDVTAASVALTAAGFVTAFVVHEACHGVANLAGIEPPQGDLRALDTVGRAPHGVFAAVVLGTAALDVARYVLPDVGWLPWVSRGSKVVTVGLVVAF